jgi:proline racemase
MQTGKIMTSIITKLSTYNPNSAHKTIHTIDMHTAGEPLRVYLDGMPISTGKTVLEYRQLLMNQYDQIRTSLMYEPRGHMDMYGCILTEPENEDSDFGVIFLHNEGYSTMCGHAIIAITTLMYETGIFSVQTKPLIKIDAPAGQITAFVEHDTNGKYNASFLNVPSFVYKSDLIINVESIGNVKLDVVYGGAFYAYVDAKQLNLEFTPKSTQTLIDIGMKIKHAVMDQIEIRHPFEPDLSFLYGTIFISEAHNGNHSRNVCIFAEGEVDRSPTGTGVSGRLALHHYNNELSIGETITIESILGTTFDCEIESLTTFGDYNAIIPKVQGNAYIIGKHQFIIDENDPLKDGFLLR